MQTELKSVVSQNDAVLNTREQQDRIPEQQTQTVAKGVLNKQQSSFADHAKELQRTGLVNSGTKKNNTVHKMVIGTSASNNHVRHVDTIRSVDIFVSRLHPQTVEKELIDCVSSVKGGLNIYDINCVKLNSKYEELYSSFHVEVKVSSCQFKEALDLFASPEVWPVGVFVKRYFRSRHGSNAA